MNGTLPPTRPPRALHPTSPHPTTPAPMTAAGVTAALMAAAPVTIRTPPRTMTCLPPATRTLPEDGVVWTRPWRTPITMTGGTPTKKTTTWPGPARRRCGRIWGRSRPRWPAPRSGLRMGAGARAAGCHPALDHPGRPVQTPGLLGRIGPITAEQPATSRPPPKLIRMCLAGDRHQRCRPGHRGQPDPPPRPAGRPAATGHPDRAGRTDHPDHRDHTLTDHHRRLRRRPRPTRQDRRGRAAGRHGSARPGPPKPEPMRPPEAARTRRVTGLPAAAETAGVRDRPGSSTCRKPTCREPTWRASGHTHPYDQDGVPAAAIRRACRGDHQLKQHPRWKLEQTQARHLHLDAPAGRTSPLAPTPT